MGLYADVNNEVYCPWCGYKHTRGFQTKDTPEVGCIGYTLEELQNLKKDVEIYKDCNNCRQWISINIRGY